MAQKKKKKNGGRTALLAARAILRVAVVVLLIVVLVKSAQAAYSFGYSVFTSEAMEASPGTDVVVTVTEGMSDRQVGKLLESKGLIRDSLVFTIQCRVYGYEIYPGSYVLNTSQTVTEMVELMSEEPETEEADSSFLPEDSSESESSREAETSGGV
ncbi:MAG: endolytic transglycosylase MltG [Lachnospiraceae bacterium]|nr:endolytic transglycosylase MltG [Lachnospiraceae bacterium]MCD8123750.1 endolytic transglycosylase MltG [Lachnospiraceae bacterium]